MQRYDFSHGGSALAGMPSRPDGEFVKYDDAQSTIARLTAELAQARAEAAAAYERAADFVDSLKVYQPLRSTEIAVQKMIPELANNIRALATEPGTTALAEALDAETRACADELPNCAACGGSAAILARIDQRKEGGA